MAVVREIAAALVRTHVRAMVVVQQSVNIPVRARMSVKARVVVVRVTTVAQARILARAKVVVRSLSLKGTFKAALYIAGSFRVPNLQLNYQ